LSRIGTREGETTNMLEKRVQCLFAVGLLCTLTTARPSWFQRTALPSLPFRIPDLQATTETRAILCPRGGAAGDGDDDEEEERYSRQVYAVGKRAHGLIRSSTIYLDGPASSGLLYETAKNLALSGIRKLVLVQPSSASAADDAYYNAALDDLGKSYMRAARAEIGKEEEAAGDLLVEYIKRLNPFVDVSVVRDRSSLTALHGDDDGAPDSPARRVLVSVDRPYTSQIELNNLARANDMSFVSMETAGVFGRIFCDFGSSFDVYDADGETPLVTPLLRLEASPEDGLLVTVHCMEGEKHDVSKGDTIRFQYRNGDYSSESCKVVDVKSPYLFVARLETVDAPEQVLQTLNTDAASFSRVKIPETIHFVPLEKAAESGVHDQSLFTACDLDKSWDNVRRKASFGCFQALATFSEQQHRLPTASDREDFGSIFQELLETEATEASSSHVENFVRGCAAKFSPLQAIFGAIGAQEALKAATGLYFPVKQYLLYDCDEVLSKDGENCGETISASYDSGLRYILGDGTVDELQSKRIFVVGAGAIGCEILKNLASLGAATKDGGNIILTDNDTIEKSNLSRQFLFRDSDIGKFKSLAAKESVLRFQPLANVEAHSSKVGPTEENIFGSKFWTKKVDTVLNALDNMDARLYIDSQCVANHKSLVDAGTLGPKGNVQTVVPHESESYASSADPPEKAIPVCTLKNFPYAISHTIQWGRDLFDGYFRRRPSEAEKFVSALEMSSIPDLSAQAVSSMGEEAVMAWAKELTEDLGACIDQDQTVQVALDWAVRVAWELFYHSIDRLLDEHPLDSRDDDDEPFWSGSRRPPRRLRYLTLTNTAEESAINENLVDFVQTAARLRIECYKSAAIVGIEVTKADAENYLSSFDFEGFMDDEAEEAEENDIAERIHNVLEPLISVASFPTMTSADFEKDDDANGHVAFVNAASNLRAICYGIPPVDAMETRRIAGNIIPAMITTTACVSALSCIELIKLVQKAPLIKHRSAFINLALPFFAFTVPLPAEPVAGLQGREYTLWDRLTIHESKKAAQVGGLTLASLIKKIQKLASADPASVAVSSISLGPFLLYANFLHEDDKAFLESSVWDAITEALEETDDGGREEEGDASVQVYSTVANSYDFTVVVEDIETGDEAELPPISLTRYKPKK
jgi:ubiquitin-activating enzyme E1